MRTREIKRYQESAMVRLVILESEIQTARGLQLREPSHRDAVELQSAIDGALEFYLRVLDLVKVWDMEIRMNARRRRTEDDT